MGTEELTSGGWALIQSVQASTVSVVSGSTQIPMDDTIPQNTEGFEVLTASITPKDSSNILLIDFLAPSVFPSGAGHAHVALFQDSTANALSAGLMAYTTADGSHPPIMLSHSMVAGTTSSTTFKIRIGPNSAITVYLNAMNTGGTRFAGGVSRTTLRILEVKP